MSSLNVSRRENQIILRIRGHFDYNLHQAFRNAYRNETGSENYIIDLADTETMDSAALGMLLLLREHAGGDKANIRMINANEKIRDLLRMVRFQDLFVLS